MEAEENIFTAALPETVTVADSDLALRRFEERDAEILQELATEEATAKYVPWAKGVTDIETSRQMIGRFHNQWLQGLSARYLITHNNEACGYFGVWPDNESDMYEIGFALLPQHRGKGIVKQVMDTMEEMATTNLKTTGLIAHIDEFNEASRRTIVKQGFHPTDKFNSKGERRYEKSLH